ncbi:MAG: protein kinase [Lachnospiraceae bacterium]|jgi:serine/threonine protein kinase|nr:protein kinase [Lachnospiraceae bacterium]
MYSLDETLCPNCFKHTFNNNQCSSCGYTAKHKNNEELALPIGYILNDNYTVGKILGIGGFGITYLAKNNKTGDIEVIKEYFPTKHAIRDSEYNMVLSSSGDEKILKNGLKAFEKEANTLRFFKQQPNIVHFISAFDENDTMYYVMEYLDGVSLSTFLKSQSGKINLELALDLFYKIAMAVQFIHGMDIIHRDISPENIFITKNGIVKLIDFGAMKFISGDLTKTETLMVRPSFSPIEQYSNVEKFGIQGTWTDVYALASVFYFSVSGEKIPEAKKRAEGEEIKPLNELVSDVSATLAIGINQALNLDYKKRIQNALAFANILKSAKNSFDVKSSNITLGQNATKENKSQSNEHVNFDIKTNNKFDNAGVTSSSQSQAKVKSNDKPFIQINGSMADGKFSVPVDVDIKVGRQRDINQIVINDSSISRQHLVVRYDATKKVFYILNNSSNGVFSTEGVLYQKGRQYLLQPNSIVYLIYGGISLKLGIEK